MIEKPKKWLIDDINDFQEIIEIVLNLANRIAQKKSSATIVALHGDLGSGKTTFTKQLAKALGITENVSSPTYVIKKSFEISEQTQTLFTKLIHIDTYRIDLADELIKLGWDEDISDFKKIIALEWPENVIDILPENTIHLHFKFVDEITREVEIK